jgi:hypothetical protein
MQVGKIYKFFRVEKVPAHEFVPNFKTIAVEVINSKTKEETLVNP